MMKLQNTQEVTTPEDLVNALIAEADRLVGEADRLAFVPAFDRKRTALRGEAQGLRRAARKLDRLNRTGVTEIAGR